MIAKQTTEIITDGVHRLPENGIKVVIIGAGVGGLQAALECWRKGCDVVVLEKAEKLSTLGELKHLVYCKRTTFRAYTVRQGITSQSLHPR